MASTIDMPINDVMRGVTLRLRLTGVRRMGWRIAAGVVLLRAAARVIGCGVEVEIGTVEG